MRADRHIARADCQRATAADLNAWDVKQILESTGQDIGDTGPDYQFGAGLLDAETAVKEAQRR